MKELSARSGVSIRTIYNAFDDKQGVIVQSLLAHHETLFNDIAIGKNESRNLIEATEMCRRVAIETTRVRNVANAAFRSYFSNNTDQSYVRALHALPTSILQAWMRSPEADLPLIEAYGAEVLEQGFSDSLWALVAPWTAELIDDEGMILHQTRYMIEIGLAFGNELGRASARKLLANNGFVNA